MEDAAVMPRSVGCFVFFLMACVAFLVIRAVVRITDDAVDDRGQRSERTVGASPSVTSIEHELVRAAEKKQSVNAIRLRAGAAPIDGTWLVSEVGEDCAVFEGAGGRLVLDLEEILGFVVVPKPSGVEPGSTVDAPVILEK
jgi:hypothetical protein